MYKLLASFTRIFLLIGALALTQNVLAQGFDPNFDEDCNPIIPTIPSQCQPIVSQIEALDSQISALQENLIKFPGSKAATLKKIQALEAQLSKQQAALEACQKKNAGPGPQGRPIATSTLAEIFNGTASLQTAHPRAPGPFAQSISIGLLFSRNRCTVTMTSFPQISVTTTVPIAGKVTITVTKTGGGIGEFHPISGRMVVPIALHFNYSTIFASDDDASFLLTTGRSISPNGKFDLMGQPRQANGSIRLVGTTSFMNGFLSPSDGSLTVSGSITQLSQGGGEVPPQCQQLANEIATLEGRISNLQDLLTTAPPPAKPNILKQIKTLEGDLAKKQAAFDKCKK